MATQKEVDHPVNRERSVSISIRVHVSINSRRNLRRIARVRHFRAEIHHESQRDERVGQREHEISRYSRAPSPQYKLVEFEGRVAFVRLQVFEVDRQVEREREERHDDQVDQSDRLGRDSHVWVEGSQVVHAEADGWAQRLRGLDQVLLEGLVGCGLLEDSICPLLADHGCGLCYKL